MKRIYTLFGYLFMLFISVTTAIIIATPLMSFSLQRLAGKVKVNKCDNTNKIVNLIRAFAPVSVWASVMLFFGLSLAICGTIAAACFILLNLDLITHCYHSLLPKKKKNGKAPLGFAVKIKTSFSLISEIIHGSFVVAKDIVSKRF